MSLVDSFVSYEVIRRAFLLGLRIRPILKALDYDESNMKMLDVGCGFGHLSKYFVHCHYTGIDIDADRIDWAKRNLGENEKRRFILGNVSHIDLPSKSFDKALGYGILHHLSDHDASLCMKELSRLVNGKVVFSDPVYSQYHFVNNVLCRLDRGAYVRRAGEYLDLCRRHMEVKAQRVFYAHNGLAKYFLITCLPKE